MNNINSNTGIITFNIDNPPTHTQDSPLAIPEMLKTIFAQLNIKSLGCISLVSKAWNTESSQDDIWMVFANEFNVQGPNFKSQIRESETGLDKIYVQINKKMWESASRKIFFKKLTETLFKDNIRKIEIEQFFEDSGYVSLVTLTLRKEKQVSFSNLNIFNFRIPEKVAFIIRPEGFTFQEKNDFWKPKLEYPIEINCSPFNLSSNFCNSIELHNPSAIILKWTHKNIFFEQTYITCQEKKSLLSPTAEKDNFKMCNFMR